MFQTCFNYIMSTISTCRFAQNPDPQPALISVQPDQARWRSSFTPCWPQRKVLRSGNRGTGNWSARRDRTRVARVARVGCGWELLRSMCFVFGWLWFGFGVWLRDVFGFHSAFIGLSPRVLGEQGVTVSKKTEGNKFKRDAPAEETDGLLSNCFFWKGHASKKMVPFHGESTRVSSRCTCVGSCLGLIFCEDRFQKALSNCDVDISQPLGLQSWGNHVALVWSVNLSAACHSHIRSQFPQDWNLKVMSLDHAPTRGSAMSLETHRLLSSHWCRCFIARLDWSHQWVLSGASSSRRRTCWASGAIGAQTAGGSIHGPCARDPRCSVHGLHARSRDADSWSVAPNRLCGIQDPWVCALSMFFLLFGFPMRIHHLGNLWEPTIGIYTNMFLVFGCFFLGGLLQIQGSHGSSWALPLVSTGWSMLQHHRLTQQHNCSWHWAFPVMQASFWRCSRRQVVIS